jgi:SAM-dependent methyltransferase
MNELPVEQHNKEILQNLRYWKKKPALRKIYHKFYKLISGHIDYNLVGDIVEIGSGIGNLKSVVPRAICTDIFNNPWIDRVENAYRLTFENNSISNIVLFDVLHHLEYPGTAFTEFKRVLNKSGRIIIFEPAISLLGRIVYGVFHHEPMALKEEIKWKAPPGFNPGRLGYYAAQGNASRIFFKKRYLKYLDDWNIIYRKRISSLAYVCSGGYRKPQLLPGFMMPLMDFSDRIFNLFPSIFATRLIVVLGKK